MQCRHPPVPAVVPPVNASVSAAAAAAADSDGGARRDTTTAGPDNSLADGSVNMESINSNHGVDSQE